MMKFHFPALTLAALFAAAPAVAQQGETAKPEQGSKQVETPKPQAFADIDALIQRLGADDFQARRDAEQELREVGEAARDALEDAVRNSQDPELRWRAHRVLRALDRHEFQKLAPTPLDRADQSQPLREMIERLRAGHDDSRFLEMEEQIESLQRHMDEMMRNLPGPGFFGAPPGGSFQPFQMPHGMQGLRGTQQGLKVDISPEGVRVEVEEKNEDGETDRKVYEAPSLEEFRATYPEVAERYLGQGGAFRLQFGQPQSGATPRFMTRPWQQNPQTLQPLQQTRVQPAPQGPKLGVYIAPLAPALREYLDIEAGRGLLVESVVDGSLAESLGIEAKDIVLTVDGKPVAMAGQVSEALAGVEEGEEFVVQVHRRGALVELRATRPVSEKKSAVKTLKPVELR